MTETPTPAGAKLVAEIIEKAHAAAPLAAPSLLKRARHVDWRKEWQRDDKGQPIANLANVLHALRCDPALADLFAFDEMQGVVVISKPVPLPADPQALPDDDFQPRPACDNDLNRLQEFIQVLGLPRLGRDTTHQAVDVRAREEAFHPIRDWLRSLSWDERPRLSTWLHTYLGCENSLYVSQIGAMFFISMVARIMQPGCKADYMLVLEGPQGAMKSTVCQTLGGEWFSDNMPAVTNGKDVSIHLRGKWLIEIAELSAISRAEDAELKAFITRTTERFRPPYGRLEVEMPRQCVFIGTTNKAEYLRDETGGRRYWPVSVGQIDPDALVRDREQLFAEAVHLYNDGRRWWPSAEFEREHIKPQQEKRFQHDTWEEDIAPWLKGQSRVTVGQVASQVLFIDTPKKNRTDQLRIIACLERLGWRQGPRGTGGIRWYVPEGEGLQ